MKNASLNLRKLRQVVVLARNASYARAAEELNISVSALSRSIKATEADLGVVLFSRGKGGVWPTPAGGRIVREAILLLESAARFDDSLLPASAAMQEVSLGLSPLVASVLHEAVVREALALGNVRLTVEVQPGAWLLQRLLDGQIDFFVGIAPGTPHAARITRKLIGTLPLVARVRSGHPLAAAGRVTPEDLDHYPLIGTTIPTEVRAKLDEGDTQHSTIRSHDYRVFSNVVKDTDAICRFARSFATPGLIDLSWEPHEPWESLAVALYKARSAEFSKIAQHFIAYAEHLISSLPEG